MLNKYYKIFPWFLGTFIIINLLLLDFVWMRGKSPQRDSTLLVKDPIMTPTPTSNSQIISNSCPVACAEVIEKEIARAIPSPNPAETISSNSNLASPVGPKSLYMSILSSLQSNTSTEWTDVNSSDFYLDLSDYQGLTAIRWEIHLKALNGAAPVYARLYDVTNKRGVDFSELMTSSETYSFLRSANLRIWRGNNLYRIQMKSANGTQADLIQARLKIIY